MRQPGSRPLPSSGPDSTLSFRLDAAASRVCVCCRTSGEVSYPTTARRRSTTLGIESSRAAKASPLKTVQPVRLFHSQARATAIRTPNINGFTPFQRKGKRKSEKSRNELFRHRVILGRLRDAHRAERIENSCPLASVWRPSGPRLQQSLSPRHPSGEQDGFVHSAHRAETAMRRLTSITGHGARSAMSSLTLPRIHRPRR